MIAFALAVFFLIITPGPGVLSAAGVGSAFGYRPGLRYVTGLCVGNNLVSLIVIAGLAAFILSSPYVRTVLVVLSTGYLFYLALRIAFAGSKLAFIDVATKPGIRAGVFLQLVNPKAYAVNTALFTSFAFMPENLAAEIIIKILIFNIIWVPLHLVWLMAGVKLNELNLSHRLTRTINIFMALSLSAVVSLSMLSLLQ